MPAVAAQKQYDCAYIFGFEDGNAAKAKSSITAAVLRHDGPQFNFLDPVHFNWFISFKGVAKNS